MLMMTGRKQFSPRLSCVCAHSRKRERERDGDAASFDNRQFQPEASDIKNKNSMYNIDIKIHLLNNKLSIAFHQTCSILALSLSRARTLWFLYRHYPPLLRHLCNYIATPSLKKREPFSYTCIFFCLVINKIPAASVDRLSRARHNQQLPPSYYLVMIV